MTSTNWKELVHPAIVEFMPENARFENGVPNIAAVTRAGILADQSGKYDEPRVFTNEEIQRQVALLHDGGTPIRCIRWYRNNIGPRKTSPRAKFKDAYAYFKESGKTIPQETLAKIAEDNLHIIFGARGADLKILSTLGIMENYRDYLDKKYAEERNERLAKARANIKTNKVENKQDEKEKTEKVVEIKTAKPKKVLKRPTKK